GLLSLAGSPARSPAVRNTRAITAPRVLNSRAVRKLLWSAVTRIRVRGPGGEKVMGAPWLLRSREEPPAPLGNRRAAKRPGSGHPRRAVVPTAHPLRGAPLRRFDIEPSSQGGGPGDRARVPEERDKVSGENPGQTFGRAQTPDSRSG